MLVIYFKQSAACSQACNLCPKVGAQLISLCTYVRERKAHSSRLCTVSPLYSAKSLINGNPALHTPDVCTISTVSVA